MKKNLLALLVLFATMGIFTASAQVVDTASIPAVVKTNFHENHPNAQNVEWQKSDQNFQVRFSENNALNTTIYSATGQIISSEKQISTEALPAAVATAISKDFPDYKIDGATEITADGAVTYRVVLSGDPNFSAWYKADGTLIRKSSEQ